MGGPLCQPNQRRFGEGLGSILALSAATDLISFSGGFPDPATFPGPVLAEILRRLIAAGDASAMQYAPTPGLPKGSPGPGLGEDSSVG
jgi:DNA-binding transcriptional MocR family regulator